MTKRVLPGLMLAAVLLPTSVGAACPLPGAWLKATCDRLAHIYQDGNWDLYVTGYGFHDRNAYSAEKFSELNAKSWGGGVGKHVVDARGNEDMLVAMAFLDSHRHVEPLIAYARQWYTEPVLGGFSLGGGFLAGVSQRADVLGGVPFPLALPVVSARYRHVAAMGTFIPRIPGGLNAGNVFFLWGRYAF